MNEKIVVAVIGGIMASCGLAIALGAGFSLIVSSTPNPIARAEIPVVSPYAQMIQELISCIGGPLIIVFVIVSVVALSIGVVTGKINLPW